MKPIELYLGMDVHKDSITIAIAEPGSKGEVRLFGTIENAQDAPLRTSGFEPRRDRRIRCDKC